MNDTRSQRSPLVVLLAVGFSVFVAADDLTVVSTMLRPMIVDVGLVLPDGLNDAAWIVNAYLIAFVAVMPLAGRLSDVIGRRRLFMMAYSVFLVGTIVVPVSVSWVHPFAWLLVGRVLTAVGGGAMLPVALAAIADVYPAGRRARALGGLGAIETLGWVWGPLYGAALVRFLDWRWQFWLNIPLTIVGMVAVWWALADLDRPRQRRVDWVGAGLLTASLVSLSVALLNGAEIQSVTGLDELTGQRRSTVWLYPVAAGAGIGFVLWERGRRDPLIDGRLLRGRSVVAALIVNLVVGAGLVVAMVDVPLFVNAVELDIGRAAVASGIILSSLTAAMAVASYVGGRATERTGQRSTSLVGTIIAVVALVWMALTWSDAARSGSISFGLFAVQLAVLGAGFGLTVAPTSSAVVDAAPSHDHGTAAGLVMLFRLLGLCIGLSVLTAWALHRFDALRATIELPPLGSDGFEAAVLSAQRTVTAAAIADTFAAAAGIVGIGVVATLAIRHRVETHASARQSARDHASSTKGTTMDTSSTPSATPSERPPQAVGHRGGDEVPVAALDDLRRRMNLLVGALGLVVLGAIVVIVVLIGRVNQATADADQARLEAERVGSGAALYASQIQGFQEQLTLLQPEVSEGVDDAIEGLRTFGESTLEFPVEIDQTVSLDTEVTIKRTVEVPIKLDVPIDQTFETTINIDTPVGEVPVDVDVPVDVTIPIDQTVSIPIDETVPIEQDVPIKLEIPVEVDIAETELATLTESFATVLETISGLLDGMASPDTAPADGSLPVGSTPP